MFRLCAILIALASVVLGAQDPDDAVRQQQLKPEIESGKTQFQQTCGFCHGRDGRGASGPDLIRSALVSHDVNGNLIAPVVRNGRPEKGMPAFQLSDTQIRDIAAFLHAQATDAAGVARRIPSEYPLQKLLVGNAEQGKTYFAAHCSGCHSVSRDFAHIATKYKPFDLQTKIAFPEGAKPALTVRTKDGASFEGEQTYADEFTVSLRDSHGWIHTWPRKEVQVTVHDPLQEHEVLLQSYTDQQLHDLFAYLETLK